LLRRSSAWTRWWQSSTAHSRATPRRFGSRTSFPTRPCAPPTSREPLPASRVLHGRHATWLGSLRAVDGVDLLVELLRDKRLAPWYKRLFGGDFVQVGFIRRNALVSLRRIDHVTAAVEEVTTAALGDPYYEARVEAARSIGALGTGFSASGRHQAAGMLARALGDRWLEVVVRAAEALGEVGEGPEALSALLGLRTHRFWIVRAAALRGLRALVERGEVEEVSALAAEVRGFILAATDFRPEFTIRTSYAQLLAAIRSRTEGTSCCR
jgi:UDP-N-acetylglucosamine--N-acetylmuramyl-(pentapeptide) pyrophosphoryl-undecaprenol N-acetylglucosamine transferase